jgi:hypothetical protein
MTTLLRMCSEPGCGKIMVGDNWVGKEYPNYQKIINDAGEDITHGYCDKHLYNNSMIRGQIERRRMRVEGLI